MPDLFPVVKKHIDAWDPLSLLAPGCPKDEFDSESRMIARRIRPDSTEKEIAAVIFRTFASQFDGLSFTNEECLHTAEKIAAELRGIN